VVSGRSFRDLADCPRAFDDWRPLYNHERPHEALGMATPAQRYRPSPRPFPEVPPAVEYGPNDEVRKVGSDGFIRFRNRDWRVGNGLRGELIALRPSLRRDRTERNRRRGLWTCGQGCALPTGSTGKATFLVTAKELGSGWEGVD
jgi:Integrase core domain